MARELLLRSRAATSESRSFLGSFKASIRQPLAKHYIFKLTM